MSRRIIGSPEQPRWFRQTDMAWEPFHICEREFSNDNAKPTFGLTPWLAVTADLQVVQPSVKALDTDVIAGVRTKVTF